MLPLLFLVIQLLFAIYLIYYIVAFLSGAPFVPTSDPTAKSMITLAQLRPGMVVYDLGSGDGRLLLLAAQKGARAVGIEINPLLVILTHVRFLFSSRRNLLSVRWQSFWKTDMKDADAVFIYLLPLRMEKLEMILKKRLKKGTLIISNSFIFPHMKMVRQDESNHVYVYRI
jgi:predicted RNA methylase